MPYQGLTSMADTPISREGKLRNASSSIVLIAATGGLHSDYRHWLQALATGTESDKCSA